MPGKKEIVIIKIDPAKRTIARIRHRPTGGVDGVRRVVGAKELANRMLMAPAIEKGAALAVGCGMHDQEAKQPGFRFPGTEVTHGVAILYGYYAGYRGMGDCPVTLEWVRKRIIWGEVGGQEGDELPPIDVGEAEAPVVAPADEGAVARAP